MRTDDLLALGTIAVGALASFSVSLAVILSPTLPPPVTADGTELTSPPAQTSTSDRPIVDFAIIRDGPELMVGPESPETGWGDGAAEPGYHPGR